MPVFKKGFLPAIFAILILVAACKKEATVYGLNEEEVYLSGANKPNGKNTEQFISIAYSDLFGKQISNADLIKLNTTYAAFGDKKLIEEMIIKNFLNKTGVQIPSNATMRADVNKFIQDSYKKFFNRAPKELELWYLSKMISGNAKLNPEMVYYAMLTSNEYRHY